MTREETIKNLLTELIEMVDNGSQRDLDRADEISNIILKTLEQKSCEDCISRQAVLNIDFDRICVTNARPAKMIREKIDKLPSVQPKTGYWIDTGSGQECSECGEVQYGYDNFRHFCANCGARMLESEE